MTSKSALYARLSREARDYANKHTVYSSRDWQALWAAHFQAYKAGVRSSASFQKEIALATKEKS